jgi:hypothetical protein
LAAWQYWQVIWRELPSTCSPPPQPMQANSTGWIFWLTAAPASSSADSPTTNWARGLTAMTSASGVRSLMRLPHCGQKQPPRGIASSMAPRSRSGPLHFWQRGMRWP